MEKEKVRPTQELSAAQKVNSKKQRKLWQQGAPYHFAPEQSSDPWKDCMRKIDKYDDETMKGYREDIDTLLVFTGLFSAVVTSFTAESFSWLSSSPVSSSAIRINILWFLALTLSLCTVLVCILCKQWMREYQRDGALTSKEAFVLRQLRFQSWESWYMPTIISSLPIFLQLSLALFLAGILDLLWSLNVVVAIPVTIAVIITGLFVALTTLFPTIYHLYRIQFCAPEKRDDNNLFPCAFKSPQAWFIFRSTMLFLYCILPRKKFHYKKATHWLDIDLRILRMARNPSTASYGNKKPLALSWDDYLRRGLRWASKNLGENIHTATLIFHCVSTIPDDSSKSNTRWCTPVMPYIMGRKWPSLSRDQDFREYFSPYTNDPRIADFRQELLLRQINTTAAMFNAQCQISEEAFADVRVLLDHLVSYKSSNTEIIEQTILTLRICASSGGIVPRSFFHHMRELHESIALSFPAEQLVADVILGVKEALYRARQYPTSDVSSNAPRFLRYLCIELVAAKLLLPTLLMKQLVDVVDWTLGEMYVRSEEFMVEGKTSQMWADIRRDVLGFGAVEKYKHKPQRSRSFHFMIERKEADTVDMV